MWKLKKSKVVIPKENLKIDKEETKEEVQENITEPTKELSNEEDEQKASDITKDNNNMKTIKFYPSDRSLLRLDGKLLKGYTIDSIPDNINSWFNYKGLTYVTS